MIKYNEIEGLVDETIMEFAGESLNPYDKTSTNPSSENIPGYLTHHRHEYIRTIIDIVNSIPVNSGKRILEIGAFFGLVSICLSKLGYRVVATDSPEYISMVEQQRRYKKYSVETSGFRLQDYILPFEDECFDVIIMCEVLEHLNFNPLPLLKEINRIGRAGSLFYLSTPNQFSLRSRISMLLGKHHLQPIGIFFDQLDKSNPMVSNDHWREYTAAEVREILTRLGYRIERQYHFARLDNIRKRGLRSWVIWLIQRIIPSVKENQTTLAVREKRTDVVFHIPKTVHPTIDTI